MEHNGNGDADRQAVSSAGEPSGTEESSADVRALRRSAEPDVLLEVPNLTVDELTLDVESLKARVALHAGVGNMVVLDVGADVGIDRVDLDIRGVHAEALLKVRLDRVYDILARALATVEQSPQLLQEIQRPVGELARDVGQSVEGTARTTVERGVKQAARLGRRATDGNAHAKRGDGNAHAIRGVAHRVRGGVAHRVRATVGKAQAAVAHTVARRRRRKAAA